MRWHDWQSYNPKSTLPLLARQQVTVDTTIPTPIAQPPIPQQGDDSLGQSVAFGLREGNDIPINTHTLKQAPKPQQPPHNFKNLHNITRLCFNCGGTDHDFNECPLLKCYNCGRMGHTGHRCKNPKQNIPNKKANAARMQEENRRLNSLKKELKQKGKQLRTLGKKLHAEQAASMPIMNDEKDQLFIPIIDAEQEAYEEQPQIPPPAQVNLPPPTPPQPIPPQQQAILTDTEPESDDDNLNQIPQTPSEDKEDEEDDEIDQFSNLVQCNKHMAGGHGVFTFQPLLSFSKWLQKVLGLIQKMPVVLIQCVLMAQNLG